MTTATKTPTFALYEDDLWNSVGGGEKQGFFDKIMQNGPIDGKYSCSIDSTQVDWRQLPFYRQVALIRIKDPSWDHPDLCVYFLTNKGELTRLDGTSPPIHMTNSEAPIKVTEANVLDYLKFFCFFVRGDEGPFLISEDMDSYGLPKDMDESTSRAIEATLRPATYEGKNNDGHFMCDAIVFYANALFLSNFAIQPSGMIEMLKDLPLLEDLPTRVDMPVSWDADAGKYK